MSQLPEVREADASPEIAAIYADIKATAALPQINLIFRYFATHEGMLEWIWQALRPLYQSDELARAGAGLMAQLERRGVSPLPAALSGDDLAACSVVIDAYNRANPQNLIALIALVHALERAGPGEAGRVPLTPRRAEAAATVIAFPQLPRRDALSADAEARVARMTARHPGAPGAVPSMYLHLTLWPTALETADVYLQPIIESPDWTPRVAGVIAQADRVAAELAPAIELSSAAPDAAALAEVKDMVKLFTRQMIPELISVGRLLAVA